MKKSIYIVIAAAGLFLLPASDQATAGEKVADPVSLFGGNGRYWIPRSGDGKGIIKLYRDGSARMLWNDQWTFMGSWTQNGDQVTTQWEEGAPVTGNTWTLRTNDDPSKEYTASSEKPYGSHILCL